MLIHDLMVKTTMLKKYIFTLALIIGILAFAQMLGFSQTQTGESRAKAVAKLLSKAKSLEKHRKFENAIVAYSEVLKFSPANVEALQCRAYMYLRTKRYDQSITDYTELVSMYPKEFAFRFNRALVYQSKFDYALALVDIDYAIMLKPGVERLLVKRADINIGLDDLEAANRDVETIMKSNLATSESYATGSVICFKLFDTDCLISMSTKSISLDSHNPSGFNNRGYGLILRGQLDSAMKDLKNARRISPDWSFPINNIALIHILRKEWSKAAAEIEIAKTLEPMTGEIYLNQGLLDVGRNKLNDALQSFSKAIEINPKLASAYLQRARVYFQMKRYDLALEDVNAAVKYNKRSFQSLALRSQIYDVMGRRADAGTDRQAAEVAEKAWPYNELRIEQ